MKNLMVIGVMLIGLITGSANAAQLTSITLDPENASGTTTNAPGAWSTSTGDSLAQLGVVRDGVFLNSPGPGFSLGEISINLHPGINTFDLYGYGIFPSNLFYGAVLFFDGVATPPQLAVFNSNGGTGDFSIQPAGAKIIGGASGGLFFDSAPGASHFVAADGSTIEVIEFTVNSSIPGTDMVSLNNIGADGIPDTVAHLSLRVTPVETFSQRVSVASDGTQANNSSGSPSANGDGRYVTFVSDADNLVIGDTNGVRDIFVHDRLLGETARISVSSDGSQANGRSQSPSISDDGRYVVFSSSADNLVPGDNNQMSDVFIHDRITEQTSRISISSDGSEANGSSDNPSISADGRYVAFVSAAANLAPEDTNSTRDVFVHDRTTGKTTRVSVSSDGVGANGYSSWDSRPAISADGRYVAFASDASNLVPGDTNGTSDIFVHDRIIGRTSRVSVDSYGNQGNGKCKYPAISADGRVVSFESLAFNLSAGDTEWTWDVFVHDRTTAETTRLERNDFLMLPLGSALSADGRNVAFTQFEKDNSTNWQIYVYDRATEQTHPLNLFPDETQPNVNSFGRPSFSADGRYVAFASSAGNLVENDTNNQTDIFVAKPVNRLPVIELIGDDPLAVVQGEPFIDPGATAHDPEDGDISSNIHMSGEVDTTALGPDSLIYTVTDSQGLESPPVTREVVVVPPLPTDLPVRVNLLSDGIENNHFATYPSLSADGRFVAFVSFDENLVPGWTPYGTYVYDRLLRQTTRVSVDSDGIAADEGTTPSISADGRYVAFTSYARNLVTGDTNNDRDVFVHDRSTGRTSRVSVATDGSQMQGGSWGQSISADGRYVAFLSYAAIGGCGAYVHDRETGLTTLVSVASDGSEANGPARSEYDVPYGPSISADGRYVAFTSQATNLVEGDTNLASDVFIHDRQTGETAIVSVASDGTRGNGFSHSPRLSDDGQVVAFASLASNLVPGDRNNCQDIFVHDRATGETARVSVASNGKEADGLSASPLSVSADGRYIAFGSSASTLVSGDTNGVEDIFLHDRIAHLTTRVSVAQDGSEANDRSRRPSISANGSFIAFESNASNLAPGDNDTVWDVYVAENRWLFALRLNRQGNGGGTVNLNPPGDSCGEMCFAYPSGTSVTLTATAADESTFTGWSGGGCSGTGSCVTTINAETTVTATFVLNTYNISGRATDNHGNPLSGVNISSVPGGASATTASDGYYVLSGLPKATYSLTPSRVDYVFSPGTRSVNLVSNVANVDFQGTAVYSVSGRVTDEHGNGIPGAMVLSDTGQTTRTDSNGFFEGSNSLKVMEGNRTFTPSKSGYTFVPASLRVSVSNNISGLQFKGYNKPPIVMVHGWRSNAEQTFMAPYLLGGIISLPRDHVPEALEEAGYHVEFANLQTSESYTPSFQDNIPGLVEAIDRAKAATGQPKVIVIAHSMGGLVSRAYIEGSLYRDDVSALFTFGSPHLGTPVAVLRDLWFGRLGGPAVSQMTPYGARIFNRTHQKRDGVDYHVIGGDAPMDVVVGRSCLQFCAIFRCWTIKCWDNRVPTWAGGHAADRNFWAWKLGNLIPGQDDGFVSTDSATGKLGIFGLLDRGSTDEVHGDWAGEHTYFNRKFDLSRSYFQCLKKVLVDKTTNTCGRWHTSERTPLPAAVAMEDPVSLVKASSSEVAESSSFAEEAVPLETGTLVAGQTLLHTVQVDGGSTAFAVHWTGGSVAVTLIDPNDQVIDPAFAADHPDTVTYRIDETMAIYTLPAAVGGEWRIRLEGGLDIPAGGTDYSTFVVFEKSTPGLEQHTPLEFGTLSAGQIVAKTLRIEGGPTAFSAHWMDGSVDVTLVDPNGQTIDPEFAADHPAIVTYGADETTATYSFADAVPGEWQIRLAGGSDIPAEGIGYSGFALVESSLAMTATMDKLWYVPNDTATITASFAEPPASATITAALLYTDGTSDTLTLTPTGGGQYAASFSVGDAPGYTQVSLTATGTKGDGTPFERGEQLLFQVSPASVKLTGEYGDVAQPNPEDPSLYNELTVAVGIDSTISGNISLSADLADANGNSIAHSLTSEEVAVGPGTLTLRFKGEDIFAAQQDGPYTLTNLLLTDNREAPLVVAEVWDTYSTKAYDYRSFAGRHNFPTVSAEGPYSVDEGDSITLAAIGNDPENDALNYMWDLDDDGIFETLGQDVTFSAVGINGPSTHIVRVRVTDRFNFSTIDETTVDVLNVAPKVEAGSDATIQQGAMFSGSGFFIDPGNDTWTASVDYGDESGDQPLALNDKTFELSHYYPTSGTYTVNVTVNDGDEGIGVDSLTVTVVPSFVNPGDCNNDGQVSIAEVQGSINIYLGLKETESCVDTDESGSVSIAEVQKVINGYLGL